MFSFCPVKSKANSPLYLWSSSMSTISWEDLKFDDLTLTFQIVTFMKEKQSLTSTLFGSVGLGVFFVFFFLWGCVREWVMGGDGGSLFWGGSWNWNVGLAEEGWCYSYEYSITAAFFKPHSSSKANSSRINFQSCRPKHREAASFETRKVYRLVW